jgi:transposase
VEDQATVLHLLTKRRQDLVAARTQTINRLHRLLMDLVPGGARRNLTTKRAAALLAAVTPAGAPAVTRWQLATELVDDISHLEQRIAAVEARIKAAVAQSKTTLVRLFGVGPVLAATFLGEVGDIGRFPSKHHFAAHTGTAPLEASSGQVVRHRLSRAGDRKLNHALYMMAMAQVRRPSTGQAYYRRKLAEGKSPKEALRCLKRRLSDAVYRCLVTDQHRHGCLVAATAWVGCERPSTVPDSSIDAATRGFKPEPQPPARRRPRGRSTPPGSPGRADGPPAP